MFIFLLHKLRSSSQVQVENLGHCTLAITISYSGSCAGEKDDRISNSWLCKSGDCGFSDVG